MKNINKNKSLRSNIIYGILIVLAITFAFNTSAKTLLIRGLMRVGLFNVTIPENPETATLQVPDDLPELVLKDGNGKTVTLSSLKGKVVFLNFWATWCPPCIAEMPSINKLHHQLEGEDDMVFLMVDVDGKYIKSHEFMEKNHYDLPVYTTVGNIPPQFFRGSIPTTLIINKEGHLMIQHEGAANYADPGVEKLIKELINK